MGRFPHRPVKTYFFIDSPCKLAFNRNFAAHKANGYLTVFKLLAVSRQPLLLAVSIIIERKLMANG